MIAGGVPHDAAEAIIRIREVLAHRSYHHRDRVATEVGTDIDATIDGLSDIVHRLDDLVANLDDEVDDLFESLEQYLLGILTGPNLGGPTLFDGLD